MIDDPALRWTVSALFAAGAAGYLYLLAVRPGRWPYPIRHLPHLVMPIAMIAMAWPAGGALPTVGPMLFFLVAAAGFAIALTRPGAAVADRLTDGYHAAKMLAMVWMYAVMTAATGAAPGHAHHPAPWTAAVNTLAAAGFAAALWWLGRYVTARRIAPLSQALMACGAAIMFAVMV